MFYIKNLPTWERALRIVIGIASLGFAYFYWGVMTPVVLAALIGASLALTGLAGWCPMCALLGRKLQA